jgi:ribosomal protein S18 acetylase RimI-like enzyme
MREMSAGKCTIRNADDADFAALTELYRDFLEETSRQTPEARANPRLKVGRALRALLRRERAQMLVAEAEGEGLAEGKPVGFAFAELRPASDAPGGTLSRAADFLTRRRTSVTVILPERAWLGHLYVAPAFRRRGIASALVRAALDWAAGRRAELLELNVLASNIPARRLYEKLGLSEVLIHYRANLR